MDCKLAHMSLVISTPTAQDQKWHIDGEHLYPEAYLKVRASRLATCLAYLTRPVRCHARATSLQAHACNVFLPLRPLTLEQGPTQFCLGSQVSVLALQLCGGNHHGACPCC